MRVAVQCGVVRGVWCGVQRCARARACVVRAKAVRCSSKRDPVR